MNSYEQIRSLHTSGELLLLPNAWDVPSALAFEKAGFDFIGTTSWGIAALLGYRDGEHIPFDQMFTVVERILKSCSAMVTVDMESGYAEDTNTIIANIGRVVDAGAVGINFEDSVKNASGQLRAMEHQAGTICSIKNTIATEAGPLFINARTDTFIVNKDPERALRETIERAQVYAEAGADCLFVPFLSDETLIGELIDNCVLPVNILALPGAADKRKLQELGVSRLSLGNGVYDVAARRHEQLAGQLRDAGSLGLLFGTDPIE
ncbi:isocitrate lyase/PEP mutase family protein [Microbulbifer taiwanensis]|uniref:Isocitrate lyase/phosphoenolpyruvate mutase family protein n=1 Tax=Microbulbifer taiwanensis TaxID=986746 RepID=A0ABW1YH70_9GAMM|nr:isocitrate lyase/phosphoenolpyruvate mutase family protein [Microbulbifer taiwanensis]